MKIAIPSDDQKMINRHFGRSKGFVIVTIEDEKVVAKEYVDNKFTGHAHGNHEHHSHLMAHKPGTGNHSHKEILDAIGHCQMVVAGGMGQRMINDFFEKQIEVVLTRETEVDGAVNAYLNGTLKNEGSACSHHH